MPNTRRFSTERSFVADLEDPTGALFCSLIAENPSAARLRMEFSSTPNGPVSGSIELLVTSEQLRRTLYPETLFTDLAQTPVHFIRRRILFEVAAGPVLISVSALIDAVARAILEDLLGSLE